MAVGEPFALEKLRPRCVWTQSETDVFYEVSAWDSMKNEVMAIGKWWGFNPEKINP